MKLIAIDADGVLLNYHAAYGFAWARAFGELPEIRNANAYWPMDYWKVERLSGAKYLHFRAQFDELFWRSIPPHEGALEACLDLQRAGYELVCVSALDNRFLSAREQNLLDIGFPIQHVYCTDGKDGPISPKANVLQELMPIAFVDDYLPYMRQIPLQTHAALITRGTDGSPNQGADLALIDSRHYSLFHFAQWWLSR